MAKSVIQSTILTGNGGISVAPGARIEIRNPAGLLVPLWLDRDGAQPATNPFTADVEGFFRVYADAGRVNITASQGDKSQEWRDVVLSGTAATHDVTTSATDATAGRLMKVGDGGWMGSASSDTMPELLTVSADNKSQVMRNSQATPQGLPPFCTGIHFSAQNTWGRLRTNNASANIGRAWVQGGNSGDGIIWTHELYHTGNTTIDSNGFLKNASPIAQLYNDEITKTEHLEIAGATLEKVDTGHYVLRNVPLLSRDGWYIETPKDRNGNIYFYLDYEEDEAEGALTIRTYVPDYSGGRAQAGEPVDILEGRFVSLRFAENPALYPEPEEEPELEGKE